MNSRTTGTGSGDEATLELCSQRCGGPWSIEVGGARFSATRVMRHGEEVVLGSSRTASLRIDDRAVSGRHAVLRTTPRGVMVADLDSKNGLFVGGARVEAAILGGGECSFVIGRTTVTVRPALTTDAEVENVEPLPGVAGRSAAMRRVVREVRSCAALRAPVLLQGESGSGKDVVARALHDLGRRPGSYIPLNVGAIPESLADTELFGHRRGAFTGAVAARSGAFEQAHRGTLFLDEVADLSPAIQVKLLRVVEDGLVRPVGGDQPLAVDVRIVSATWAPLEQRVTEGRFRADLFHRISTLVLRIPPLRRRKSDIPELGEVLLRRLANEMGEKQLSSAALASLVAYSWPGNIRELSSVLYRAAIAAEGRLIESRHVEAALPRIARTTSASLSPEDAAALLREHEGNISAAARAARVPRSTFRSWLERADRAGAG